MMGNGLAGRNANVEFGFFFKRSFVVHLRKEIDLT